MTWIQKYKEARRRAENGAAWFDIVNGGWEHNINLGRLDIQNPLSCVLGQGIVGAVLEGGASGYHFLYDFAEGCGWGRDEINYWMYEHGFHDSPLIGDAWADLIEDRLTEAQA